ncbi:hypothetical protein TNIN_448331 [Trichonephila inaurata madagascariensis]|uniref:Uncharacterized protein n=1 Tax=Trichonephila inaurata madagascariensis TaxID=2747483 RepID=A0A8X7BSC4_9ARAC|nr:hypothetical protein TNIN_448331 [Trichonephila inaurata madagascariensis]
MKNSPDNWRVLPYTNSTDVQPKFSLSAAQWDFADTTPPFRTNLDCFYAADSTSFSRGSFCLVGRTLQA